MLLQHCEEFQSKGLVLPVSALAAVLLERSHDENIDEVERFLGHFIQGVTFHKDHVFVGKVHIEKGKNGKAYVLKKGPLAR
jgi:hypothetical protein